MVANAPATPVLNSNSVLVAESESDFPLGGDFKQQVRELSTVLRSFWESDRRALIVTRVCSHMTAATNDWQVLTRIPNLGKDLDVLELLARLT
jgi:hypothetical protein